MHVCFLCNEYPPGPSGGLGTKVRGLARSLVARGHQATVVGFYPSARKGIETDQGVTVVRLAASSVPWTGFAVRAVALGRFLRRLNRERPIDLLEGSELSLATLPRHASVPRLIRISGGHHFFAVTLGQSPRPWRSWLERRSFARADFICSGSRFAAEVTRTELRLGDRPIEIIPHPVDTTIFRPRPEIAVEKGLLVFTGTLCEKKGIRQLTQAMPAIVEACPGAHLLAIGRDSRDRRTGASFRQRLIETIPDGVRDRIVLADAVEQSSLPEVLARAQVCVFPSHMETVGNVNLEAMAMGRPIVSSSRGPGPEVIEDGTTGLLCDPHAAGSIATAVIRLLIDGALAERLGSAARARAEEVHALPVVARRNEAFFERCIQERSSDQLAAARVGSR